MYVCVCLYVYVCVYVRVSVHTCVCMCGCVLIGSGIKWFSRLIFYKTNQPINQILYVIYFVLDNQIKTYFVKRE